MFENSVYKPYYDTMYRAFSSWVSDFERYAKDAEHIRNNYLPDAGVAAMEKLRNDFRARTSKAIDNIMAAGNELHDAIAKNWTPNIFNYEEKVTALYGCKYLHTSAADFDQLAESYSKSPTMLMVLRGIAEERDVMKDVSANSPLRYADRDAKMAAANDLARSVSAMMYNDDPSLCKIRRTTVKNFEAHVKRYTDIIGNI